MSDWKLSPSNKEAEEAVLGCVLVDGDFIYEKASAWIRDIDGFYYKDNKVVWEAMGDLYKSRSPIDLVTVAAKCKDMYPKRKMAYFVTSLVDETPSSANVEHYARIVWEKHIQREAAKTAQKLYNTSFSDYGSTNKTLEAHSKLIDELKQIQPSMKKDINVIVADTVETLQNGSNIIPFGMKQLDYPAGGMTRKEVTVIGGRPGHGKTTLAINIVRSLIGQGFKVMMFNREMSNEEMMKKIMVMESKSLKYGMIRKNELEEDDKVEINNLAEMINVKYENLMMYDNVRSLSESMIEVSKYKPDVIVDDYIQLIQVDGIDERRFQLENIMQEYKWISKKEDCSSILISQLNREIERRMDPKPRLSDFAESGVIEQTAETAMITFYGWNFDNEKNDKYEMEIIVPKSRYGQIGTYVMGFNGNKCRFYTTREEALSNGVKSGTPF